MPRARTILVACCQLVLGSTALADSFMSSSDLAGGVETISLPSYLNGPLSALQMLAVMQWKGLDLDRHDLGGITSPADPEAALRWLRAEAKGISPDRRFLAAYKAMWDAEGVSQVTALLAEMHRAKLEAALEHTEFAGIACQAVMALGIALAGWQGEMFSGCDDRPGLWSEATAAKIAAAACFAEAVAITRSMLSERGEAYRALRPALRSSYRYASSYQGVCSALGAVLKPEALAWLEARP